jgi:hypothetical protein
MKILDIQRRHCFQVNDPPCNQRIPSKALVLETNPVERGYTRKCLEYGGLVKIAYHISLIEELDSISSSVLEKRVNASLRLLQMRHPILRCRPIPLNQDDEDDHDDDGDDDPRKPNHYNLIHDWNLTIQAIDLGSGSFLSVWKQVQRVTEPFKRAMMQAIIFQNAATQSRDILLVFNHAIADGPSVNGVGREFLASLLGGREMMDSIMKPNLFFPPTPEALRSASVSLSYKANQLLSLGRVVKHALFTRALSFSSPTSKPLSSLQLATLSSYTNVIEFTPEETRELLGACRVNKSTLTSAIVAANEDALRQVLARENPDVKTNVIHVIPISVRGMYKDVIVPETALTEHSSFTTFLSRAKSPIGGGKSSDLWSLSQKVTIHLKECIKSKSPLGLQFLVGRAAMSSPSSDPNDHSTFFSVSNLGNYMGRTDLRRVGIACHVPHTKNPSLFFLTQPDGGLSITVTCPEDGVDALLIKNYEEFLTSSIRKLISSPGINPILGV